MCLAVPGEIIEIRGNEPMTRTARASFGGVTREINLAFVPEANVGDFVLVHAGFAISIIDENEAKQVFEYLQHIEEADQSGGPADEISR
jgi:hydrogenase expression/formation protein HypC